MRDEKVKIQITEDEWAAFPKDKRERIKEIIMENYGWDIASLVDLEEGDKMVCPYCNGKGCEVCEEDKEW